MFEGISPHWQLYVIIPPLEPPKDDQNDPSHSAHLRPGRTTFGGSKVSIGDLGLYQQGYRGIVTANADADLRERAPATAYRCTRRFAAGLLEGIEHWISQDQSKSGSPIAWQFRSADPQCRDGCEKDGLVPLASN